MPTINNCHICYSETDFFADAELIGKHGCRYYRCTNCGFIQTEDPHWLDEAYSEAINRADIGLVGRNLRLAKITQSLISMLFNGDKRFVDYGGGYGLFVRLMRDAGFDFYRYDKHCTNLFAQEFEAEPAVYELLTAFELFEHLVDPLAEIEKMLNYSRNIFFTTEILPEKTPLPGEWSYYGLEHGQHISFYTRRSLEIIADKFSLNLCTDGKFRHLLTEKRISAPLFKAASIYKLSAILSLLIRRHSLTPDDYRKITGHKLT